MRISADSIHAVPTEIKLHTISRILEVQFDDGEVFYLPFEYLRVFTQSAEAVGHAPGQAMLQVNKEDVTIVDLKPIGNYGVMPTFSDGHNSGIYTWALLYKLGAEYETLWEAYLQNLQAAGLQHPAMFSH